MWGNLPGQARKLICLLQNMEEAGNEGTKKPLLLVCWLHCPSGGRMPGYIIYVIRKPTVENGGLLSTSAFYFWICGREIDNQALDYYILVLLLYYRTKGRSGV